uniref:CCHC-type domain-containing protein n=1 Tax=Tanacetum cinerariifolium TaxID=118510 RepID=A0A6L2J5Y4_TANCI|nr:hypothetical protein [Tanacetum cinerariifolium]
MLGAAGVQIQEKNLDTLKSSREDDGTSKTVDPWDLLGLCALVSRAVGFLRGTSVVVVILIKWHTFPTIVKNQPLGVKLSTSASRSQPSGNTKKDKIQEPPSSTQRNKVEAYPRTVKSSLKNKNCDVEPKGTANVLHSKLNANSELICVKCNGCMLSDNHDLCVLNFISDVNAHAKSKSVKKISKKSLETNRKEVLIIDYLSIVETGKVFHTVESDIVKLVVENESFGKSSDEFDKETGSFGRLQPKQADLNFVHALNDHHSHEIRVVRNTAICLEYTAFCVVHIVAFCLFWDRPSMLAPGRYPQWRSRFLHYVDTRPNGEALRKCILSGPYKPTTILVHVVKATNNSPAVPEHTTLETPSNMSPENKAHFLAEKEAIHLILKGIGDDIYSTVDACQTGQEMWEAIERLQQGESLNIQDVKTNLFWEFGKFTSHDGESMESYYTRFYKLMNEMIRNNLTMTTVHQYQNEVNELCVEKLARNANPLALVATAQASQDPFYQTLRSHISQAPSSKPLISSRSHTSTRHKGKEISKPITPLSETASEEDIDPEQAQRDKDIEKNLALIAKYFKKNEDHVGQFGTQRTVNIAGTREKVRSRVVQKTGIQCFNCKEYGHFAKECRKPKRVKDFAYHKEKMLLCKQAEQEAHYSYMAKIQEVPNADSGTDSEPVEQVQNNDGYNVFANELQHFEQSESVCNTPKLGRSEIRISRACYFSDQ